MAPIAWSYYATPLELGFRPWALDFAADNYGGRAFPIDDAFIFDPTPAGGHPLEWQTEDWDPALRFWTLPWDPGLAVWLRGQDASLPSILAACEFAGEHAKWQFADALLIAKGWLTTNDHLRWQTDFAFIRSEIHEMLDLMEDDRDRYLAEINAQADGLAAYFISFLGIDSERRPWTIELIRCGLAIGNLVYMYYKQQFRRVRPSTICPGLATPFGPPRHPSFPSGHSFLGHFIALLLLEIDEVAARFGEPTTPGVPPTGPLVPATLAQVMSADGALHVFTGPLLWLGARLAKNRERAGVHYRSDSLASRWIAGAIWALLTTDKGSAANATPPGVGAVTDADLIDCPTLRKVLRMAKAEWA